MKLTGLITNIRALQFFQLFRFVVLFAVGIAFAQAGLSNETIGVYEKFIFLSGAVSFFWVSGLTQSMLSYYSKTVPDKTGKNPFFFHIFIIGLTLTVLTSLLILTADKQISSLFLSQKEVPYLTAFIIYFLLSTPSFVVEFFYILLKKPKHIVAYGIITFGVQFIVVIFPIIWGKGLEYSLWGLCIISAIRFLWSLQIIFKYSSFRFSFNFCKKFLAFSYPLILMAMISGSLPYIDGVFVSHYFDDATFAIFRYGAREFPLTLLMANALSNAMIPEFSSDTTRSQANAKIKSGSLQLMHIFFPTSIALLFFSRELYPILFNPDFIQASSIFNILLLLVISRLVFPQTLLLGYGRNKDLLTATVIEFVFKVGLTFLLITRYGVFGVAISTVLAFYVEKLWLIIVLKKKLKLSPKSYIPVNW
ncbi:MAG: hypothetical protein CVU05_12405, partial [Bacteroidetes bacterium HGW-Bacteroidetes-21]